MPCLKHPFSRPGPSLTQSCCHAKKHLLHSERLLAALIWERMELGMTFDSYTIIMLHFMTAMPEGHASPHLHLSNQTLAPENGHSTAMQRLLTELCPMYPPQAACFLSRHDSLPCAVTMRRSTWAPSPTKISPETWIRAQNVSSCQCLHHAC